MSKNSNVGKVGKVRSEEGGFFNIFELGKSGGSRFINKNLDGGGKWGRWVSYYMGDDGEESWFWWGRWDFFCIIIFLRIFKWFSTFFLLNKFLWIKFMNKNFDKMSNLGEISFGEESEEGGFLIMGGRKARKVGFGEKLSFFSTTCLHIFK